MWVGGGGGLVSEIVTERETSEICGVSSPDCPGLRLSVAESHCLSLRMLYRDCARPAAPRIEKPRSEVRHFAGSKITIYW